jgi:site-specific DNA-adenine methylase
MKYMGSKNRISKYLKPIIESYIDKNTVAYIEPFVGGANMIDKIDFHNKIGYDKHKELIALLNAVKNDYELPDRITVEHYKEVRQSFRNNDSKYEDWYYGAIGFLGAFRGLFFGSQGCKDYISEGRTRNNYVESRSNILKQKDSLKSIKFICSDYKNLKIQGNSVIYCDPPYKNTSQDGYSDKNIFDYDYFYQWCGEMSKNNIVLVSEYEMPKDFECIWEKEVSTNLSVNSRKKDIEKLFIAKERIENS